MFSLSKEEATQAFLSSTLLDLFITYQFKVDLYDVRAEVIGDQLGQSLANAANGLAQELRREHPELQQSAFSLVTSGGSVRRMASKAFDELYKKSVVLRINSRLTEDEQRRVLDLAFGKFSDKNRVNAD